ADLLDAHLLLQESDDLLDFRAFGLPLDPGVDILAVLAKDHHVDELGPLHGTGHTLEVAHRSQTHVEVEHLAKRDVERADTAANGRGEWSFDADQKLAKRVDGFVREPAIELLEGFLARVDLHPGDLPLAAVDLLHRGIEDMHGRAPNVGAGSVTFDERQDRSIGNFELAVAKT